jgi:hypothetical protein
MENTPMSKKEALIALWRLLAELFDDKARAKRLAEQSGVNPAQISADGAAADYWWRILVEAHRRSKVQEIVKNASGEIEERAGDLRQAYRVYAGAPDTGEPFDAPAMTPGQVGGIQIDKIEAANVAETQIIDQRNATFIIGGGTQIDTGSAFVGSGSSVQTGLAAAEIAQLLAPVLAAVQQSAVDPAQQAAALQEIEKLKAELAKGKNADDLRIAGILDDLAKMVPGAAAAVVSAFGAPPLAGIAGPVTRFVLDQVKRK